MQASIPPIVTVLNIFYVTSLHILALASGTTVIVVIIVNIINYLFMIFTTVLQSLQLTGYTNL